MRSLVLALAAVLALTGPAVAGARPSGPDPAAPELRGTPYLVRDDAHRVTLHVRFDRPLGQRFDGEPLATAVIDGRIASLAPVAGLRHGRRSACYMAQAWTERDDIGRLVTISVSAEGAQPVTRSALVAIRAPRPGDARGAPLRC
jgi:hypothetical protein